MSEQSQRPIDLAVFGAGYWGTKIAREYASIESSTNDVRLLYVVDSSRPALDAARRELSKLALPSNCTEFFADYEEVLRDSRVKAVHIALPNHLHYQVAHKALESGKHVLLEKPIATTSSEAFKLARLAEEMGLVLAVGHIFRFNNALRTVKEIVETRRFGRIYYANLTWATHMQPLPKDRDIVFDLAPHPIDVLNYLLDEWPTCVGAIGDSYVQKRQNAEEVAFISLELPGHILASIYLSWIHHGLKERSISLICEKGTITCDPLNQRIQLDYSSSSEEGTVFPEPTIVANNTIRDMQYHFIERIRSKGPLLNNAMIGAQVVQILEQITTAMRVRRAIPT